MNISHILMVKMLVLRPISVSFYFLFFHVIVKLRNKYIENDCSFD